jgi:phosphoglycolate phosphatase-like HAD superfamily hydrolase
MVPRQKSIKAIIFDLDGTLLNIYDRYTVSYIKALKREHISTTTPEEIINMRRSGMSGLNILKHMAPELSEPRLNEINELRREITADPQLLRMDSSIPGLEKLLEDLKNRNIKLAILTVRRTIDVKLQLNKLSLLNYFDNIVGKERGDCVKEKHAGLIEILDGFRVKSRDALFVGDTYCDIKAGKELKMHTIGVLSGLSNFDTLKKEGPEHVVEDVTQIITLV